MNSVDQEVTAGPELIFMSCVCVCIQQQESVCDVSAVMRVSVPLLTFTSICAPAISHFTAAETQSVFRSAHL